MSRWIRKIEVAKGIYWIEVPEADLYVLCGCPSDSVKHLMKKGLIVNREDRGVVYETGPNAILLSDVLVQNGSFSNLAEFPVLQMLYRQGMILPDHPNNTGAKPLLIGSGDQVQAQLRYIHRGNYGLVSEEEIRGTGIAAETAREMMALKLRFAFGKIRPSEELIDTRIVESAPVEIKNRVLIRRIDLNRFEFQYRGERTDVDLSLAPCESYGVPYPLSFHQTEREYFAVIHSGQGDGWDYNRPCMSSILMFQGKIYLIDAGPNSLYSLKALGISINEIEGIFHTHAHDDHFADLTILMRSDHRIKYYATPLVRASVTKKLSALISMEEKNFNDFFEVCDLAFGEWNSIEGLEVKPIFSPHPVETNIFLFRTLWGDGHKTYAHFADITALGVLERMISESGGKSGISGRFFERVREDYLTRVDLKKIDVGGGFVHGNAEDFRDDPSGKIILSHTSEELIDRQKEIGSGAPFGMIDLLIPAYQNYPRQYAFRFLNSYFPSAPRHQLKILLNNPLDTFNPDSIILKRGTVHEDIYLILTGNVEQIDSESGIHNLLSAGALVGEMSGMSGTPATETFRAGSFVQALRLPARLYLEFIKRNRLYDDIVRLQETRRFLQKTRLFGEAISYPIQNRIAQAMKRSRFPEGYVFSVKTPPDIFLVERGEIELYRGEEVFEMLGPGDFFMEEATLLETPEIFSYRALSAAEVYRIPGSLLLDIPVVRWKLFETLKKRLRLLPDQ